MTIQVVLWFVATILFTIAVFEVPGSNRLVAAGLAFLSLGFMWPLISGGH